MQEFQIPYYSGAVQSFGENPAKREPDMVTRPTCSQELAPVKSAGQGTVLSPLTYRRMFAEGIMAERKGFEPSIRSPVYSLSRGAPSTTRPPLRGRRYPCDGPGAREARRKPGEHDRKGTPRPFKPDTAKPRPDPGSIGSRLKRQPAQAGKLAPRDRMPDCRPGLQYLRMSPTSRP